MRYLYTHLCLLYRCRVKATRFLSHENSLSLSPEVIRHYDGPRVCVPECVCVCVVSEESGLGAAGMTLTNLALVLASWSCIESCSGFGMVTTTSLQQCPQGANEHELQNGMIMCQVENSNNMYCMSYVNGRPAYVHTQYSGITRFV